MRAACPPAAAHITLAPPAVRQSASDSEVTPTRAPHNSKTATITATPLPPTRPTTGLGREQPGWTLTHGYRLEGHAYLRHSRTCCGRIRVH